MEYIKKSNDYVMRKELLKPSDAADLMKDLIDDQIKFYKLKRLSEWIGDHNASFDFYTERIAELVAMKSSYLSQIKTAKDHNKRLEVSASYELRIV